MANAVRFVESNAAGLPVKRKQVQHACDSCRRRKKRCIHAPDSSDPSSMNSSHGSRISDTTLATTNSAHRATANNANPAAGASVSADCNKSPSLADEDTAAAASRLLEFASRERIHSIINLVDSPARTSQDVPRHSRKGRHFKGKDRSNTRAHDLADQEAVTRFIGYSNPEGIFVEAMAQSKCSRTNDIGVWANDQGPSKSGASPVDATVESTDGSSRVAAAPVDVATLVRDALPLWPRFRVCAVTCRLTFVMPPVEHYRALRKIFLQKIYPLLPIFTEASLDTLGEDEGCVNWVIKLAVSLAAATQPEAKKHLYFHSRPGELLEFSEFNYEIGTSLLDFNRTMEGNDSNYPTVARIRALVLASLFYQPVDTHDQHVPSRLFASAVHDAHTVALHLTEFDSRAPNEEGSTLFLGLWIADRLHSAMLGRPILMHTRDNGRNMHETIKAQRNPCFRLLALSIWQLDRIIDLYRPSSAHAAEQRVISLPVFEQLCMHAGAIDMPTSELATMEVLYHAIAILSVHQRPQAFGKEALDRGDHLPNHAINARRSVAADRVCWVMSHEETSAMPWMPFAVSLALSVYYRKMRYSQLSMFRERGRAAFHNAVVLLNDMGSIWTRARIIGSHGEEVARMLEKARDRLKSRLDEGATLDRVVFKGAQRAAIREANNNGLAVPPILEPVPIPTVLGSESGDTGTQEVQEANTDRGISGNQVVEDDSLHADNRGSNRHGPKATMPRPQDRTLSKRRKRRSTNTIYFGAPDLTSSEDKAFVHQVQKSLARARINQKHQDISATTDTPTATRNTANGANDCIEVAAGSLGDSEEPGMTAEGASLASSRTAVYNPLADSPPEPLTSTALSFNETERPPPTTNLVNTMGTQYRLPDNGESTSLFQTSAHLPTAIMNDPVSDSLPLGDYLSGDLTGTESVAFNGAAEDPMAKVDFFNFVDESFDLQRADDTFRAHLDIMWPQMWNPTWEDFRGDGQEWDPV